MGLHTSFDLAGKVALVTGGGGGLGRLFCETLAQAGADVAAVDVDGKAAEETAERVRRTGKRALGLEGDVSVPRDVDHMVAQTVARLGALDILVNNAGINARPGRIADTAIEDFDRVLAVNLRGVFLCTRAALPVMMRQRRGNVINIASILGLRPVREVAETKPYVPYAIAKAGVIRLTKEIAAEYSAEGIRANCIAPGWHRGTALGSGTRGSAWDAEERARYEQRIARATPMGRRGEPDELSGLLVYLASDASSFMTGQVLVSDGGICL